MTIAKNALREKIRRKELYIAAAIGFLVLTAFSSGAGTITINGKSITDYESLIPILITIVNVICGLLAIVLSIRTIPNEYERKTSHLVWVRGISQAQYHGGLALANIAASLLAAGMMYMGILLFSIVKHRVEGLPRLLPAFLILSVSVTIVSLLTSVLSIRLPVMAAGMIAAICYLTGILHGALDVYRGMVGGVVSLMLRGLLFLIPDLNEIQTQAGNLIRGYGISMHEIVKGLLFIYILSIFLFIWKRKEV